MKGKIVGIGIVFAVLVGAGLLCNASARGTIQDSRDTIDSASLYRSIGVIDTSLGIIDKQTNIISLQNVELFVVVIVFVVILITFVRPLVSMVGNMITNGAGMGGQVQVLGNNRPRMGAGGSPYYISLNLDQAAAYIARLGDKQRFILLSQLQDITAYLEEDLGVVRPAALPNPPAPRRRFLSRNAEVNANPDLQLVRWSK